MAKFEPIKPQPPVISIFIVDIYHINIIKNYLYISFNSHKDEYEKLDR